MAPFPILNGRCRKNERRKILVQTILLFCHHYSWNKSQFDELLYPITSAKDHFITHQHNGENMMHTNFLSIKEKNVVSFVCWGYRGGGKSGHLKVYVKYCKNPCDFLSGAGGASPLSSVLKFLICSGLVIFNRRCSLIYSSSRSEVTLCVYM